MTVRLGAAAYLALSLLVMAVSASAQAQEIVHGADSLFVAPTVKIAWAVQKGASEEATTVVMRVVNSAGAYRQIRLDGVDPFSKNRKVLLPVRPLAGQIDLSVPRSGFADFPSCEIHFYRGEAPAADQAPSLIVYYLGVPDTTPEFPTAQAMDAYLARMLSIAK
jgi:hypothetical protein